MTRFNITIAQRGKLLTLQQLPDPQAGISQLSTQIPKLSVNELTPEANQTLKQALINVGNIPTISVSE